MKSRPYLLVQAGLLTRLLLGCGDDQDSAPDVDAGAHRHAGASGKAAGGAGAVSGQTQEVTIRFRAVVGDREFSCEEEYDGIGSTKVRAVPADFRFYLQDVKLIAKDGKEVPVTLQKREPWQTSDVALIDFEDLTGMCHGTTETNDYITGTVPAGEYQGIVFTNGVPEKFNHLEQSTLPPPLDLTDMYWAWLTGFRYYVVELQQAVDPSATASADDAGVVLPGLGLLHTGATACVTGGCKYQNRNTVRLTDFDPVTDVIIADAAAVFVETDVTQDMQCHSSGDLCAPMYKRIGLEWGTGAQLNDQTVYRVGHGKTASGGK